LIPPAHTPSSSTLPLLTNKAFISKTRHEYILIQRKSYFWIPRRATFSLNQNLLITGFGYKRFMIGC
jgi:hypothetical protein